MAQTIESPQQMPPKYRKLVLQLLESQAYRELIAAECFAAAIQYVPILQYKKLIAEHVAEELEHYEKTVELYRELGGDLEAIIHRKFQRNPKLRPTIKSWLELAVVQFLFDRAGEFHLSEYKTCNYLPYQRVIAKILEEEEGHESFGEQVLRDLCRNPNVRKEAQRHFNRWLGISLLSFGRPGTPGNRYAIEVGVKRRDSGEVMQDYLNDIKPTMAACRLKFPSLKALGIVAPKNIDLALPKAA